MIIEFFYYGRNFLFFPTPENSIAFAKLGRTECEVVWTRRQNRPSQSPNNSLYITSIFGFYSQTLALIKPNHNLKFIKKQKSLKSKRDQRMRHTSEVPYSLLVLPCFPIVMWLMSASQADFGWFLWISWKHWDGY